MKQYKIIELEGTPKYIDSQLNDNPNYASLNIDYSKDYMKCYAVGYTMTYRRWFRTKTDVHFIWYTVDNETKYYDAGVNLPYKGIIYCQYGDHLSPQPVNQIPIYGRVVAFELKEDAELFLEFMKNRQYLQEKSKIDIGKTTILE